MSRYAALIVALTGHADDQAALSVAAAIAAAQGSLVNAHAVLPDPMADVVGWSALSGAYLTPETVQAMSDARNDSFAAVTAQAEAAAAHAGLAYGEGAETPRLRMKPLTRAPWNGLTTDLPFNDLVVLGAGAAHGAAVAEGPLAEALMLGRAPVLIAHGPELRADAVVAIAWDASLEAGRAVHAALPLIATARKVVILQDPSELDSSERDRADPARLAAYLGLHGVTAVEIARVATAGAGETLITAAKAHGADLLVAGAYGHTRLREWVLGGVTRALLQARDAPHLLLAH